MDSEVVEVLREIRDSLKEIRDVVLREILDGVKEIREGVKETNARLASVETRLDQTNLRLESIDGRLLFVEKRLTNGFSDLSDKVDKLAREQMGGFVTIEGVLGKVHGAIVNNVTMLDHERRLTAMEKQRG